MKIIILENDIAPYSHIKQVKEIIEQLKTQNRDTLTYGNY